MNALVDPVEETPRTTSLPTSIARWTLGIPLAWILGTIASTSVLTGILCLGFLYRWMGRTAIRTWWSHSSGEVPHGLAAPRWVLSEEPGWRGWVGGLWENIRLGVVGALHSLLALLPAAALWMFAWRYGWDTSFTKGYDLRWIGPVTGLAGIAAFVPTMLLLPLAQARLATTRSWRTFWDLTLLTTLLKRSWTGAAPLAVAYALAGIPFTIMWLIPVFMMINRPEMSDWTTAELRSWLDGYYLGWAFLGFATTFVLKQLAARWYSNALLDAVRSGTLTRRQLHPVEGEHLERFGLLKVKDLSHRHPLVRAADWTASALGRSAGLLAASFIWMIVAFQLFVGAFFHYRPIVGWVNQPLILVPSFKYVPPNLKD